MYAPAEAAQDPLGPWKTLNAMLAENPPPPHHDVVLRQFARIGIGPGLDVDAQPEAVKQGLTRAAMTGMGLLKQQFLSGDWATLVNGWRYPPPPRWALRRRLPACAPPTSPWPASPPTTRPKRSTWSTSTTPTARSCPPRAATSCVSTPDDLPPVDSFWSLAAYTDTDMNLIPNPPDRYSVGDRTAGLKQDPDGGLTIHLQPGSPGEDAGAELAAHLRRPTHGS